MAVGLLNDNSKQNSTMDGQTTMFRRVKKIENWETKSGQNGLKVEEEEEKKKSLKKRPLQQKMKKLEDFQIRNFCVLDPFYSWVK